MTDRLRSVVHSVASGVRRIRRIVVRKTRRCETLVLFLYAEGTRYPNAPAAARKVFSEFGSDPGHFVAINNFASTEFHRQLSDREHEISGDNSAWEFSGWQRGLDWARAQGIKHDRVIFINDAFLKDSLAGRNLAYFRSMLNPVTLDGTVGGVFGKIDFGASGNRIGIIACVSWVRSIAFCVDSQLLAGLSIVGVDPSLASSCFESAWSGSLLRDTAPISPVLRSRLVAWLTQHWSRAGAIDAQSWAFFRGKATAILNERLLAASLADAGAIFFDRGPFVLHQGACRAHRVRLPPELKLGSDVRSLYNTFS